MLKAYAGSLKDFAKWLDAKRYSGQPISDEKDSLEKLGSLEKLCVYPHEESVNKVVARFLRENQNDSKVPKTTRYEIHWAVKSFRKVMGSQESRTSIHPVPAAPFRASEHVQSIGRPIFEEEQAAEDREADQFAADLEAELEAAQSPLSLSPHNSQNVAVISITLSEEPVVQPCPVTEVPGLQSDGENSRLAPPDSLKRPTPEPQVSSRVVRPHTAAPSPLASPRPGLAAFQQRWRSPVAEASRPQQTTLQQRLPGQLDQDSSLTRPSFPSLPRLSRDALEEGEN